MRDFALQLAMLPISASKNICFENGVPSNLTAANALDLYQSAKMPNMIRQHYSMFEFNASGMEAFEVPWTPKFNKLLLHVVSFLTSAFKFSIGLRSSLGTSLRGFFWGGVCSIGEREL